MGVSIISIGQIDQLSISQFPLDNELYVEPIANMYRSQPLSGVYEHDSALSKNRIIKTAIEHARNMHASSPGTMLMPMMLEVFETRDDIEFIVDHNIRYTGNAKEFVDQLDAIPKKFENKSLTLYSPLCYVLPFSVYKELFNRDYKLILDEMFECHIVHLFAFISWAVLNGLDLTKVLILTSRYNSHPSLRAEDLGIQLCDFDISWTGIGIINYTNFFWSYAAHALDRPAAEVSNWASTTEFNRAGLFLNRAVRANRLLAVAYLKKKDVLDNFYWSMKGGDGRSFNEVLADIGDQAFRDTLDINDWYTDEDHENLRCLVPRDLEEQGDPFHRIDTNFYENTAFSLIVETSFGIDHWDTCGANEMPCFSPTTKVYYGEKHYHDYHRRYGFITEKTFRALAYGHPFVVLGQVGLLRFLRTLGFKTYDSVFDESYDSIVSDADRFKAALDLAAKLSVEGFDYAAAKEIADYNKKLFWDDITRKDVAGRTFLNPFVAFLEK